MQRQQTHQSWQRRFPGKTPWWLLLAIVFTAGGVGVLLGVGVAAWLQLLPTATAVPALVTLPTPTPVPSVQLSPEQGGPGTRITVTGKGWQAGDTVLVHLGDPAGGLDRAAFSGAAIVDESGDFTATFVFPFDEQLGALPVARVTVVSQNTGHQLTTELQVMATADTPPPVAAATATPTTEPAAPQAELEPGPGPGASPTVAVERGQTVKPPSRPWRGEYFTNRDLVGRPRLVRFETAVNFDWGSSAPSVRLPVDGFSARWTRTLAFPAGTYRFAVQSDDGVRVWLDGEVLIDEWHSATDATYTAERALTPATHAIRIEYYEDRGPARIRFWWERVGNFPDWRGEYFARTDPEGPLVLERNDLDINFDWGRDAPATGMPVDGFSARWTRTLEYEAGVYRFRAIVDDGLRLFVDGNLVIDEWRDGGARAAAVDISLPAGPHSLRVEYYERGGEAAIRVWWEQMREFPDWKGEYWSNRLLSGSPLVVRNDPEVNFNWGRGKPESALPSEDEFSARWTRTANFEAGTYRFYVHVDDGARLWVDDQLLIDEWRDGGPREVSVEHALVAGTHSLRVEYYERSGLASVRAWWARVPSPTYPDWKGEYWANRQLSGSPSLVRNDPALDFNWGANAVAPGMPQDDFAVRWSRSQVFDAGVYRFFMRADDGMRLFADGNLVLNEWHDSDGTQVYAVDVGLTAGSHLLVVEYYERAGNALAQFAFQRIGDLPTPVPTQTPTATATPTEPAPMSTPGSA